jgi:Asp-tRNA(Asn)/Glu-tRNA(Gln) amidotransferase A subunit family amidase
LRHHVAHFCPNARELAGKLDKQRAKAKTRGPLYAIPVLLKDHIDTVGGSPVPAAP